MSDLQSLLDQTFAFVRETALLEGTMALLEWDERTGLPSRAAEYRAEQVTLLSGIVHQRHTDPKLGAQLEQLAASEYAVDAASPIGASIRGLLRDYRRNIQLPESFVKKVARAVTVGQQIWSEAKPKNDFLGFLPILTEIVELRREEAAMLRVGDAPLYDSLLDQYEEDAKTNEVREVFAQLRDRLVPLVQRIAQSKRGPTGASLQGQFDISAQREFSHWVASQIGFEFERGRLDETDHPFCTTLGPHDHRILTRYFEDSIGSGLYGTLHEAGHGMYEQGLAPEWYGLPAGYAASLGAHESQSRMWENIVGRSREFWVWCLPHAKKRFSSLADVTVDTIYADLNRVEPSLIRIEADEATYNLHILLRFELEQALIDGTLECRDLPSAWGDKYASYLGVRPSNDAQGVMQDVHWAAGLIGYFPTYTLGNMFASQLYNAAEREIQGLSSRIEAGDFRPLLEWLRANVHRHGRCFKPTELMKLATGESLSSEPLIHYLTDKLLPLYP